jgi:hypothetical protein
MLGFAWNHVLCKIEVSTWRDVSETARTQARKCTMSRAIQSRAWRSRIKFEEAHCMYFRP